VNSNPTQTHQPTNTSHTVTITLLEAATGKTESLIIPREDACEICSGTGQSWRDDGTCTNCDNTGYVRYEKRFELRIPAGIEGGARMRIAAEGNLGAAQAVRGDLYIVVNVSPHELFERKGKDLYCFFRLTDDELKAGGEVVVPTLLDGRKQLRIPPGINDGTVLRMAGLGLRSLEDAERGDLFVRVGNEPVKRVIANGHGPSVVTPPSTPRKSAVKVFVSDHKKGVIFTAGLLLCAGVLYLSSQRSGPSRPPASINASVSTTPAAKPTATPLPSPRLTIPPGLDPTPSFALPLRPPLSLPNGTNITPPQGPRGDRYIEIINRGDSNMALKVVSSSSQKTLRFVFVRAGGTVYIRKLPRDVCLLRWETGWDWDVDNRRFIYLRSLQQFDKSFDLRKINHQVNFTPSVEGTLKEEPLDESEFDDK
jgi:hypothetical protein